jgi:hypothetical protein
LCASLAQTHAKAALLLMPLLTLEGKPEKYMTNEVRADYMPNLTLSECSAQHQMLRPVCPKNVFAAKPECAIAQV